MHSNSAVHIRGGGVGGGRHGRSGAARGERVDEQRQAHHVQAHDADEAQDHARPTVQQAADCSAQSGRAPSAAGAYALSWASCRTSGRARAGLLEPWMRA